MTTRTPPSCAKSSIRSALLAAMLGTASVLGLAAAAHAQETTEITIWFGREDFMPADAFETFHEENPDIRVTADVIPLEQAVADTLRAARANRAPDIVQVPADGLAPLVAQGAVRDIGALLEQWQADDPASYNDMSSVAWDMASLNGTTYGVTVFAGPYWYTYRSDWLEEAGLDVPQTWDDVLDVARAMRDNDRIGFTLIGSRAHEPVWFLATYMAMGGQFEDGVPQVDSDAGVHLLSFYQTLVRENLTSPEVLAWDSGSMRAAFINGDAAQGMIGDNIYPTISQTLTWGGEWDGSVPPYREGAEDARRVMTLGWPFLVTQNAEEDEAVLRVLQYLTRPENVAEVSMRYQPGTVLSVFSSEEYNEAKPWAAQFAEDFGNLTPLPTHPRQSQIYQILLDAMQAALQNPDQDPSEIAASHQQAINDLIN